MEPAEVASGGVRIEVENVGGIERRVIELDPGVTVLTGRNATNRTSLLRALMAAVGSDDATLKGDATAGSVTLHLDGETYTREFERADESVATSGDPYLADSTVADTFAFLLGSNAARRAVREGRDLRPLVMDPVDTAAITAEIERLEAEKRRLRESLSELDDRERRRTDLVAERDDLDAEIADLEAALEREQEELAALQTDLDASGGGNGGIESTVRELESLRDEQSRVRTRLASERESVDALRTEREDVADREATLPAAPDDRLAEIDAELDRLRSHRRSLESTIAQLDQVIQFNEAVVDGEHEALDGALRADDAATPTDALIADAETVCWTCGQTVPEDAIANTLDRLRSLRSERASEQETVAADIDDLQGERRELEERRDERATVERRLADIDDEIDRREATIEDLDAELDGIESDIDDLEATLADNDGDDYETLLERHERVSELRYELDSLRDQRSDIADEIDAIDAALADRDALEKQVESIREQLREERSRIDRIEASVVEAFNEHMDAVLSRLDYANIDRIWLERQAAPDATDEERVFALHVVRTTADGAAYEDTIETLSESEREVAGLVFALAGYLAHEAYETVPFMLLDSVEAIDADRIAALVEYFAEYAPYLVAALLEGDAAALDASYTRIEMR
jgi:uncharacterized coiled-coil DUF342 family protein